MLKALDTHYDGHRFRSRAEARWAVFFNSFGVAYEYEPQGYCVNGEPYLPDFFLPELNLWLEVKGTTPTQREQTLLKTLALETEMSAILAIGPPKNGPSLMYFNPGIDDESFGRAAWYFAQDRNNESILWLCSEDYGWSCLHRADEASEKCPTLGSRIKRAYEAAQQARFEHGQTPG